jgi:hypothetical protein
MIISSSTDRDPNPPVSFSLADLYTPNLYSISPLSQPLDLPNPLNFVTSRSLETLETSRATSETRYVLTTFLRKNAA